MFQILIRANFSSGYIGAPARSGEKSLPGCAGNICANQDSFSLGAGFEIMGSGGGKLRVSLNKRLFQVIKQQSIRFEFDLL